MMVDVDSIGHIPIIKIVQHIKNKKSPRFLHSCYFLPSRCAAFTPFPIDPLRLIFFYERVMPTVKLWLPWLLCAMYPYGSINN